MIAKRAALLAFRTWQQRLDKTGFIRRADVT